MIFEEIIHEKLYTCHLVEKKIILIHDANRQLNIIVFLPTRGHSQITDDLRGR